jgi:hypothetical protein
MEPTFVLRLLSVISFEDRQAIAFLVENGDVFFAESIVGQTFDTLATMIARTYTLETSASALITHDTYFKLLKLMLTCDCRDDLFWQQQRTLTSLLLVYKFADAFPRETVIEWLDKIGRSLVSVFLISRVFYDRALQLTLRHDLL